MTTDSTINTEAAPVSPKNNKEIPIHNLSIQDPAAPKRPLSFAELLKHNLPPKKEEPVVVSVPVKQEPKIESKSRSSRKKKNKAQSPAVQALPVEKEAEVPPIQQEVKEEINVEEDSKTDQEQTNVWQQRIQQQQEEERNVLSPQSSPDGRGRTSPQQTQRALSASGGYQQWPQYRNNRDNRGSYNSRGRGGYYNNQGHRSSQQQGAYRQYGSYAAYSYRGVPGNNSSQAYYAYVQSAMEIDAIKLFVLRQIEYYFSVDNLVKDIWFRSQMDGEGYVSMNVIAAFNRIKAVTTNLPLIVDALRASAELEVSEEGDKVRKKVDWHLFLLPESQRRGSSISVATSVLGQDQVLVQEASTPSDKT